MAAHRTVRISVDSGPASDVLAKAQAALALAKAQLLEAQTAAIRCEAVEVQVRRLDVEDNDILVVRTAEKLSQEKSDAFHDRVLELAQRHGVKGVTVVVLDGCTDLTIERPSTAMAHQRPRAVPQPMG